MADRWTGMLKMNKQPPCPATSIFSNCNAATTRAQVFLSMTCKLKQAIKMKVDQMRKLQAIWHLLVSVYIYTFQRHHSCRQNQRSSWRSSQIVWLGPTCIQIMETQNANEVDGYADVDGFIFPYSLCVWIWTVHVEPREMSCGHHSFVECSQNRYVWELCNKIGSSH